LRGLGTAKLTLFELEAVLTMNGVKIVEAKRKSRLCSEIDTTNHYCTYANGSLFI